MRHLLSIVLSIILAPLIYVASGLAAVKLDAAHITSTSINWTAAEIGLAAGIVAGALYAVLVMTRLSPIGPAIAGLLYLGVTIWAFLDSARFTKAFDFDILGLHKVLLQPVGAGTLLLAVPLIATVFSRRRWVGETPAGLPYDAAPSYGDTLASAAPSYSEPPTLATPTYAAPYATGPTGYGADTSSHAAEPGVYTPASSAPSAYPAGALGQPATPTEPSVLDTWPTSYPAEQSRTADQ